MLKGDLATTPLPTLLTELATEAATGCLHVSDVEGDEALIFFRSGDVYAVTVPGRRPQLGAKLVSSGVLTPEALAEAIEAQRTELQGWKLSELLVHLGYVEQVIVEDFVREHVYDALWDLTRWTDGRWKFRKNEKTREDVAPPTPVSELLETLRDRGLDWEAISAVVRGPTAVPMLSTRGGGAAETTLDADAWSMLCKIDGERSVAELARDCGYTLFEAGRILVSLVGAGLVDIEETEPADTVAIPAQATEEDAFAALARLATEVAGGLAEPELAEAEPAEEPHPVTADSTFAFSVARVSAALSDALAPALESPPVTDRATAARQSPASRDPASDDDRRRRLRDAAAAELASTHALTNALRPETAAEQDAVVVDLAEVRREVEDAARAEAERVEAEQLAAEEAARLEAARIEAERLAAEEAARLEVARLEAERLAAEEAARVEAERLAAEEAVRLEVARLEAERLEAERAAAEEAARIESARVEAERLAAEEAVRIEAERLAAERLASEEAARIEVERLEAERVAADAAMAADRARREAEAEAAALLVELSQQQVQQPEPVAAEPDAPAAADDFFGSPPAAEPATLSVVTMSFAEATDTAALLRELSSLGVEDEPESTPAPRPARPGPAADPKKKKKGLFGR
jgi:hypothetical protein